MKTLDNQIVGEADHSYIAPPLGFGSKAIEIKFVDSDSTKALKLKEVEKKLCAAYGHYKCFCGEKK